MDNFKFERRVSLFTAVFIVIVVAFLVIRNAPVADANLVVLTRIILALAVGLLGATMPGFLNVTYNFAGFAVRATGATALFLIAYFGTPHVEALHLPDTLEKKNEISRHLSDPNMSDRAERIAGLDQDRAERRGSAQSQWFCGILCRQYPRRVDGV